MLSGNFWDFMREKRKPPPPPAPWYTSKGAKREARRIARDPIVREVGSLAAKRLTTTDPERVARAATSHRDVIMGAERAGRTVARAVRRGHITLPQARSALINAAPAAAAIKGTVGVALIGLAAASAAAQAFRSGQGASGAARSGAYAAADALLGGALATYHDRRAVGSNIAVAAIRGGLTFVDTRLFAGLGQMAKDAVVTRDKVKVSAYTRTDGRVVPEHMRSRPTRI